MRSEKKKPDDSSARQVSGTEISMENFRQTETKKSAAKEEEGGGGGGGGGGAESVGGKIINVLNVSQPQSSVWKERHAHTRARGSGGQGQRLRAFWGRKR